MFVHLLLGVHAQYTSDTETSFLWFFRKKQTPEVGFELFCTIYQGFK